MRTIPQVLGALQMCALGLMGFTAHAEPAPEAARARLLMSADQAMRDGRFADARDAFLAIWEATGERDPACNVGRLSFRIGDMPRAVEFLKLCISTAPEGTEDTQDARVELAQARRQVAELRVRASQGTEITIDGASRGRAPLVVYLAPGSHTIRGVGPGGSEGQATITASSGKSQLVELALQQPSARPNGWIVAGGTAASVVFLGVGAVLTATANHQERTGAKNISGPNGCFTLSRSGCEDAGRAFGATATMRNWSTAGWFAGASAAAATLTYTFFPRGRVSLSTVGTGIRVEGVW